MGTLQRMHNLTDLISRIWSGGVGRVPSLGGDLCLLASKPPQRLSFSSLIEGLGNEEIKQWTALWGKQI